MWSQDRAARSSAGLLTSCWMPSTFFWVQLLSIAMNSWELPVYTISLHRISTVMVIFHLRDNLFIVGWVFQVSHSSVCDYLFTIPLHRPSLIEAMSGLSEAYDWSLWGTLMEEGPKSVSSWKATKVTKEVNSLSVWAYLKEVGDSSLRQVWTLCL